MNGRIKLSMDIICESVLTLCSKTERILTCSLKIQITKDGAFSETQGMSDNEKNWHLITAQQWH